MPNYKYVKPEQVALKNHAEFNEKWVQNIIADDPSVVGLGNLILKDEERSLPRSGRLDLLLQDPDSSQRYEVEIQLGKSDESHIIRTIEYWDIERKRYPQYDHTAVIIAEDITSRFLNVISLFNGFIPLIAIKMTAVQFGDQVSLLFTIVLDQMILGLVGDDEERDVADRSYWEKRGTKETVGMADKLLELIHTFDSDFEHKYNKFYIGLAKDGQPNNFAIFRPQKNIVRLEVRLNKSEKIEQEIEGTGIDLLSYDKWGRYRLRIGKLDLKKHEDFLKSLLKRAYDEGGR